MARVREVAGGARAVEVAPERVAGWFERFVAAHGGGPGRAAGEPVCRTVLSRSLVEVVAADGVVASVRVPFGGLDRAGQPVRLPGLFVGELAEHLSRVRRIGLVLVRRGGYSVGVADGERIVASRTGHPLVHGRSSAGGWSQQRFARRRAGQVVAALGAAADAVAAVLGPRLGSLEAVVLGGDREALRVLRADPRLAGVFDLAGDRVLDVARPGRSVLADAARRARAVEIVLRSAGGSATAAGAGYPDERIDD